MKDNSDKDGEYEQIQSLQQNLEAKNHIIDKKEQQLRQSREEIQQLERDKNQIIQWLERDKQQLERERNQAIQEKEEKERQLGRVNQQLEESEQLIADFGKQNTESEEQLSARNQAQAQDVGGNARAVNKANIKLRRREGEKAPCKMNRYCDAVLDNSTVYYRNDGDRNIYAYHIPSSNWSTIPDCPHMIGYAIVVIDGVLTTVGGFGENTKLFSLTGEGSRKKWTEKFPPMPTKRFNVAALCTGTALIVAGGCDYTLKSLKTVEVLNTETQQWHIAADLPEPLTWSSLILCGDLVYLLGGLGKDGATNSAYSSSLSSILSSAGSKSLGERLVSTLT